jgi:hypothetical protein
MLADRRSAQHVKAGIGQVGRGCRAGVTRTSAWNCGKYHTTRSAAKEAGDRAVDWHGELEIAVSRLAVLSQSAIRGATNWGEIDLGPRLITIPARRMKTKRAHEVPLTPQAGGGAA